MQPAGRAPIVVLAASLAGGLVALITSTPRAPRPADAPPAEFSAERAQAALRELLGDGAPHPVGSAAGQRVRDRLIDQLRRLDLEPEVQHAFSCNGSACAWVDNVIVRVEGTRGGPALLLSAHHDSVGAGPGAGDDGHGVATILEILRALKTDGPAPRPLVAVFTDGEEAALLGAHAFVAHPRAREVDVALNIEARGTTGAARMFETSRGNRALVEAFAAGVERPSASSLSVEIYRRMPNDTDLSELMRGGLQGLNFAFIGGVTRYHTPRDDLDHLDLASVQAQGDMVLGATRALLAGEPLTADADDAYADVGGLLLLRWPAPLAAPLAALALAGLVLAASVSMRRKDMSLRSCLIALVTSPLAPLAGAAAGFAALRLIEAVAGARGPFPAPFVSGLVAALALAVAAALLPLRLVGRRVGPLAGALGAWLGWTLATFALALTIPGASAILVPPALIAALGLALATLAGRPAVAAATLACAGALAFALWVPVLAALAEAMGLLGPLLGGAAGWLALALAPVCAAPRADRSALAFGGALAAIGVIAALASATSPATTPDHPAKATLLHVTDLESGEARFVVDAPAGVPPPIDAAAAWTPEGTLPWTRRTMPTTPAPTAGGDGPALVVEATEATASGERVSALLRPRRGALLAHLVLPASLDALTVEGVPVDLSALRHGPSDSRVLTIYGPPVEGVRLVAERRGADPWTLVDGLPGLPAGPGPVDSRPADAVPYQWGDLTLAHRRVTP